MDQMTKEHVWTLRGTAARLGMVGHLAVVALCDNLLAAWKERDEAQRNLDNIKAAREKEPAQHSDAAFLLRALAENDKYIAKVREVVGVQVGESLIDRLTTMMGTLSFGVFRKTINDIREVSGTPVGVDVVDHVAVMCNRIARHEAEREEACKALDATDEETLLDAAIRVAKEAEGLYRFKVRIREALGVEKGVDMAAEVRKLKTECAQYAANRGNRVLEGWINDFRAVTRRATHLDNAIADIGRIIGAKDLTAEGVLAHTKSLPSAVGELRRLARDGLGYLPDFLAPNYAEAVNELNDKLLVDRLAGEIRNAIAREKHCGFDQVIIDNKELTQLRADAKRAKDAEAEAGRYDHAAMRQNLAEKTAALELAGNRIKELESTLREHEKDLADIDALQEEQTKLNAILMRACSRRFRPDATLDLKMDKGGCCGGTLRIGDQMFKVITAA